MVLRPFTAADAPALVAAYSEPSIQQWHVASLTDAEAAEWIAARPDQWRAEALVNWAITIDSTIVGRIGLKAIDLDQGIAEITYWVLAEHRRNGYAKRAVAAVTDWAFNDLGLHRLELTHSTQNTPSCRVAESSGYLLEGTKRLAGRHADGWHDMHLHARIATDHADRRSSPKRPRSAYGQPLIREARREDLPAVLRLLRQLNADDPALEPSVARRVFESILGMPGLAVFVLERDGAIVASAYLNVVPNLTRAAAPYAVIENVVVDKAHRRQGLGKAIIAATLNAAWDAGCYKAMLQTGSRRPSTHAFYRACGFSGDEKHAYVAHPDRPRDQ
jgi:RimJ/RimL family protein N-acetyltransferase